jgi:hypothetical protein
MTHNPRPHLVSIESVEIPTQNNSVQVPHFVDISKFLLEGELVKR